MTFILHPSMNVQQFNRSSCCCLFIVLLMTHAMHVANLYGSYVWEKQIESYWKCENENWRCLRYIAIEIRFRNEMHRKCHLDYWYCFCKFWTNVERFFLKQKSVQYWISNTFLLLISHKKNPLKSQRNSVNFTTCKNCREFIC